MPDALDGDFSRSRAVLIGTWDYRHLRPVPAAKHSLNRMRALLTSPLCGPWPQERISVVGNRKALGDLPHELVTWFGAVTDVALFYYVGHGQYDNDDRLCLALRNSSDDAVLRTTTSLSFDAVRHAFRVSKATTKIAILDCCFAGLADRDNALAGPHAPELPRSPGFYLMMASGEFSTAWCETTTENIRPQTYFTKYLVDVIENGIPGQPDRLTLGTIFDTAADALVRDSKPEPGNRAGGRAAHHVLARNAAPPETHGNGLSTNLAATVPAAGAAEQQQTPALTQTEPRPAPAYQESQSGRAGFPGRRGWIAGAAVLATVVAVVVWAVVFVASPPKLTWDDTLYPQEIPSASVHYTVSIDKLLPFTTPKPVWTITGEGAIGGNSSIVILRAGSYVVGINMQTGTQLWPPVNLGNAVSCAVQQNRIACVVPGGFDSTVLFLDADSGKILKTLKVPNRELRSIAVSNDRFIAMTENTTYNKKGFAVGYTTEGDQVWTYEGHTEDIYVVSGDGLLVDSDDSNEVVFVSTGDGHEVLRSTRNSAERSSARDVTWSVFQEGIAIQNQEGTGTDIYDLNGVKRSSVAGWEPARYQGEYDPMASPLPLLDRLKDEPGEYPDEHTIAAANPDNGHLLWRISGPELSTEMLTENDRIIMKVADPNGRRDSTGELEPHSGPLVRVYNCLTGKPVSPPISMTGNVSGQLYQIMSDGVQLVYVDFESDQKLPVVMRAYNIQSGMKEWELPLKEYPKYFGGSMVSESAPGVVSRFW